MQIPGKPVGSGTSLHDRRRVRLQPKIAGQHAGGDRPAICPLSVPTPV